ncbi:hypothetical protein ACQJBY_015262 [Aegilops geniculata]
MAVVYTGACSRWFLVHGRIQGPPPGAELRQPPPSTGSGRPQLLLRHLPPYPLQARPPSSRDRVDRSIRRASATAIHADLAAGAFLPTGGREARSASPLRTSSRRTRNCVTSDEPPVAPGRIHARERAPPNTTEDPRDAHGGWPPSTASSGGGRPGQTAEARPRPPGRRSRDLKAELPAAASAMSTRGRCTGAPAARQRWILSIHSRPHSSPPPVHRTTALTAAPVNPAAIRLDPHSGAR